MYEHPFEYHLTPDFRQVGKDTYASSRSAWAYLHRVYLNSGDAAWVGRVLKTPSGFIAQVGVAVETY